FVLIVENITLLAFRMWLIAVRPGMRRKCEGECADDGECYGLHVFLHYELSVRLFDVNFYFHLACSLGGKDDRELPVDIELLGRTQQENVRPICVEFDRSVGGYRNRGNPSFTFRFSGAQFAFRRKWRGDRDDTIRRRSRVAQNHADRGIFDVAGRLACPWVDEFKVFDLELLADRTIRSEYPSPHA